MDNVLSWSLSAVAVLTFVGALTLDHLAYGTDFPKSARLLMYGALIIAIGQFVVSSLIIVGNPNGLVAFVAAFNRAVLAGIGCVVFSRAWRRYRARPRAR